MTANKTANPNRVRVHAQCGMAHSVTDTVCPPQGVQCRTMTSQRPCGAPQCTRPECVSGYARMRERVEALRAPESDERTTGEGEPQGTPVRLSRDELWSLQRALVGRLMLYPRETALSTGLNKINEALKTR